MVVNDSRIDGLIERSVHRDYFTILDLVIKMKFFVKLIKS